MTKNDLFPVEEEGIKSSKYIDPHCVTMIKLKLLKPQIIVAQFPPDDG